MAHDHELLDVKKNGVFVFNDILLVDYHQQKLGDILKDVIIQRNHIGHLVKHYIQDDARIVGQEKANVVNVMHMLIRHLAALFLKLYEQEHAHDFTHKLVISEGKEGILIQGTMEPGRVAAKFSIESWVENYLEPELQKFFSGFQAAIADRQISLAEKIQLISNIDAILLECIQAFYFIRTGAVFK